MHCFGILLGCNVGLRRHLRGAIWWWAFPVFFLRFSKNFRRFTDIWIKKVNSFHLSSIVELQFLFCQFLFFLDSERRYQLSSILPDNNLGFGRRVIFCHSPSGPHVSLWRFVLSIEWTLINPLHESDKLLFESTFQYSSILFSWNTSRSVCVDLVTSMYSQNKKCFFLRHVELKLEVYCDDDSWSHLGSTRCRHGLPLRSVPAPEWVLGSQPPANNVAVPSARIHHFLCASPFILRG